VARWAAAGAAVLLAGSTAGCSRAVDVDPPSPGPATEARCSRLLDDLPDTVDGQQRRDVSPSDALAAAWGDPAIVLRCGVGRPAALTPQAQLFEVNGVAWFPEQLTGGYVFTTYDRTAYVEVTVPDAYAPEVDAVVDLTSAVKANDPVRTKAG
jgi:Protein of unknown function (DUF3515)